MGIDFVAEAEALRGELVERRRDLHRHPELAFEEYRTAGLVAEALTRLGMEVQSGVGRTGVIGLLDGAQDGPTVLIRADMDALPVQEANQTDYVSTVAGKMHACGHDGHTSIVLAVARMLAAQRDRLRGRVKFVFQPAEEIAGGARAMIDDGVLANPRPDVALGLHLWNWLPVGAVGAADGPIMAGSVSFELVITGKGGHGGIPHQAVDPVVCGAQIVTAFQTIVSRDVDPAQNAVLSVTQFHAGDADNIIPQQATLRGTVRVYDLAVRDQILSRMQALSEQVAAAMGCSTSFSTFDSTVPVKNDPEVAQRVRDAIRPMLGESALVLDERTMGAEDMGYFMEQIPGMFLFVGSANEERGLTYGHHHPKFDFDEDALALGAAVLARAAAAYVLPGDV